MDSLYIILYEYYGRQIWAALKAACGPNPQNLENILTLRGMGPCNYG